MSEEMEDWVPIKAITLHVIPQSHTFNFIPVLCWLNPSTIFKQAQSGYMLLILYNIPDNLITDIFCSLYILPM